MVLSFNTLHRCIRMQSFALYDKCVKFPATIVMKNMAMLSSHMTLNVCGAIVKVLEYPFCHCKKMIVEEIKWPVGVKKVGL